MKDFSECVLNGTNQVSDILNRQIEWEERNYEIRNDIAQLVALKEKKQAEIMMLEAQNDTFERAFLQEQVDFKTNYQIKMLKLRNAREELKEQCSFLVHDTQRNRDSIEQKQYVCESYRKEILQNLKLELELDEKEKELTQQIMKCKEYELNNSKEQLEIEIIGLETELSRVTKDINKEKLEIDKIDNLLSECSKEQKISGRKVRKLSEEVDNARRLELPETQIVENAKPAHSFKSKADKAKAQQLTLINSINKLSAKLLQVTLESDVVLAIRQSLKPNIEPKIEGQKGEHKTLQYIETLRKREVEVRSEVKNLKRRSLQNRKKLESLRSLAIDEKKSLNDYNRQGNDLIGQIADLIKQDTTIDQQFAQISQELTEIEEIHPPDDDPRLEAFFEFNELPEVHDHIEKVIEEKESHVRQQKRELEDRQSVLTQINEAVNTDLKEAPNSLWNQIKRLQYLLHNTLREIVVWKKNEGSTDYRLTNWNETLCSEL